MRSYSHLSVAERDQIGVLRAAGRSIYAFIYRTAQKAAALWSRDAIKDRASIHDRPKTIESRGEAGHWEGDLIICKCTRACARLA